MNDADEKSLLRGQANQRTSHVHPEVLIVRHFVHALYAPAVGEGFMIPS